MLSGENVTGGGIVLLRTTSPVQYVYVLYLLYRVLWPGREGCVLVTVGLQQYSTTVPSLPCCHSSVRPAVLIIQRETQKSIPSYRR